MNNKSLTSLRVGAKRDYCKSVICQFLCVRVGVGVSALPVTGDFFELLKLGKRSVRSDQLYNSSIKNIVKENESLKLPKEFSSCRGLGAVSRKVKKI